jgi:hypothetical protein
VVIAIVLTASTSSVLFGKVSWESLGIVGTSTLFIYSIDNLIDWKRDSKNYQDIIEFLPVYRLFCYSLIPFCILAIFVFVIYSPAKLKIALLLLGVSSLSTILRIPKFHISLRLSALQNMIANRLFISCTWTIVLVFIPVFYTESSIIRPQVWMTFAYLWQLTFISAVLWKFEKTELNFTNSEVLKNKVVIILKLLSISTGFLAITDIVLGYFPLHNLVVILAPIASFVAVSYWASSKTNLRLIFTVLNLFHIGISFLSAKVHLQ